ncbi:MAG: YeeE/YedE family protein [Pseudomonadales bacterium]
MTSLAALLSGAVFGVGLSVAQMTNPAKVLAFLDVGGAWDPSLALVMLAALTVSALGLRLVGGRPAPLLAPTFSAPSRRDIDGRLIGGAALFGIGWGLAGYCPGPALAALAFGTREALVFVAAMAAGMWAQGALDRWIGARREAAMG